MLWRGHACIPDPGPDRTPSCLAIAERVARVLGSIGISRYLVASRVRIRDYPRHAISYPVRRAKHRFRSAKNSYFRFPRRRRGLTVHSPA